MVCSKCGKSATEIGGWLERTNAKGIPGIWECRPSCDAQLSDVEKFMGAIETLEMPILNYKPKDTDDGRTTPKSS